jgi:DNA primase
MAWAEEEFHRFLMDSPEAEAGRQYLLERRITIPTIEQFRLGFAPNRWDWLLERARNSGWLPTQLERAGLLRRKELDGGHYDWFRGRVMFSIRDARSRPIAFGGRVLPQLADERTAKYINSPETPLFSKSRELYGLDVAREHFKQAGGVIVMEGYTDCLMAQQTGLKNAVAVPGPPMGGCAWRSASSATRWPAPRGLLCPRAMPCSARRPDDESALRRCRRARRRLRPRGRRAR